MKNGNKQQDRRNKAGKSRQQGRAALKEFAGQTRFRAFADLLPEIIFELDLQGRIHFSNAKGFQMTGYSSEDLDNGLHVLELLTPKDRARASENIARIVAGEDVGLIEYMVRRKDGSTFPVMVHSSRIVQEQRVIGLRGIVIDLSERKKMEETLCIEESAIESSINAIALADLKANLTYVNEAFLTMWGYESAREIVGHNAVEFWKDKEKAQAIADSLQETGVWTGELVAERKDGSAFAVHLSTNVVKDPAGTPLCLMASFIDVSNLKQAEATLKTENEKLRVIMEQSPLGMSVTAKDGQYYHLNPKFVEIFGYTREDIPLIRDWLHKAYPDKNYRKEVIAAWIANRERCKHGEDSHQIVTVRCKDGSDKTIHFRSVVLEAGQQLTIYEDITEHQQTLDALKKREAELEIKTRTLEEMNATLRVLLGKRDEDKKEFSEAVMLNLRERIIPVLQRLKMGPLNPQQASFVSILESTLNDICSPFTRALSETHRGLTPTEIQIANFIKEGRSTKEIAEIMNLSPRTIDTHRDHLRRKIGIKNKKANLRSHLLSLFKY
jgi:PAS domain S-box-containing protein